ncbi:hypothetical protein K488DRAFT_91602 [Vararia minispora EC-137]|uniref:Uncharacterized protein n=1 Tax=Vararia minispora EC-137 TaxID=1314806 RepID=A0ACB8Q5Q4_9AGAM|nr:hypothetical protein K488DRAFT_91602 [Vararia minispora EC-137]
MSPAVLDGPVLSLSSCLRPSNPPPSANGTWRRWPSQSVPQALPWLPLASGRPTPLNKWRAALALLLPLISDAFIQ